MPRPTPARILYLSEQTIYTLAIQRNWFGVPHVQISFLHEVGHLSWPEIVAQAAKWAGVMQRAKIVAD